MECVTAKLVLFNLAESYKSALERVTELAAGKLLSKYRIVGIMIKAVIFDVDGTLIDSNDVHAQSWVDAFREFDRDIGFPAVRSQIGKGGDQLLPVFLDKCEIEKVGPALEKRRGEILKQRYLQTIKPFDGVRELFVRLRDNGITIALASSAKQEELAFYMKLTNIEDLVKVEASSDDAENSKPAPDIFTAVLSRLQNFDLSEMLAIGDTPYDAEASGKAGLKCIGLLCGGFPLADLQQAGCISVYQNPTDLLGNFSACFL
jgi:beta-phosphoglucomutase-like phosphatase (HAD superfamily)